MEQGYKHFSHPHNLLMHQLPEGVEVSCSGCNSCSTGTVYVCWQCNFFLHEQCCRATRSLNHPSHPLHPLTLVPFPTYLSNSFYCNSCKIIGTGFSYSCADCEFDLHVQCAYSISMATSFQNSHPFQELVPQSWNGHDSNMVIRDHDHVPYVPDSFPIPFAHNSYNMHPDSGSDLAYVSIPPGCQNSIPNAQDPSMAPNLGFHNPIAPTNPQIPIPNNQDSFPQNRPTVSIPMSSQNPIASPHYPFIAQTRPPVSIPTDSPIPIPSTQDHFMPKTEPSVSIPTSSQNPIPTTQDHFIPKTESSVSIPTSSQNPIASPHYPFTDQTRPPVSIPTDSPNPIPTTQDHFMPKTEPSVSIPTNSQNPIPTTQDPSMAQNGTKDKEIIHFSHPHKLSAIDLEEDEENEIVCSACEDTLIGKGYSCTEPDCEFHLHDTCFLLKKDIHHNSHPEHPLTLLPLAPYNNKNGEFTCNACFSDGTGFTYHCSVCKFDLHIQCVSLPETMKREDHEHALKLYYSCPYEDEDSTFLCSVCHVEVQKDRWVYYCEPCDYGTHLGCVDCEECEGDSYSDEQEQVDLNCSVIQAQAQLQRLQIQMQMARQQAQFVASCGASLANLV